MTYLAPGEMPEFTTDDLDGMSVTANSSMMDRGYILRYSAGARDPHGKPVVVFTPDDEETRCGYKDNSARELNMDTQQALGDATLRLPIDVSIGPLDRFRLTKRYGAAIAPQDFDFYGKPKRGPSALQVQINKVTTQK